VKLVNPTEVKNMLMSDYAHAQMESMTQVMVHVSHVIKNAKLVTTEQELVFNVPPTETMTQKHVLV